jgi:hypothetical protein
MLTTKTTADLVDMLTSKIAGNELALAVVNGSILSHYTMKRLVIAMGDEKVADNIQAAMLGTQALSVHDIRVMVDGFSNALLAAEFIANVAGGISALAARNIGNLIPFVPNPIKLTNKPKNQSMPAGFSLNVSTYGNTGWQQVQSTLPAGSLFPSTGPGASFLLYNAGNANTYVVWYNVTGGSNTDPTLPGQVSVEVTINSGDSAATIAADTQAAIAADTVGLTATVLGAVVTTVATAVLNQAAAPAASVPAGTYSSSQTVSLSSLTVGAAIYYTTNGSTPTTASTLYTGPISVSSSETVKAISVASGFLNSNVSSVAYVISGGITVATPTMSPVAGSYLGIQSVTISTVTAGSTIYYTTDGSTPTTGSTLYSGPVSVASSETLKALAVHAGDTNSAIASAAYVIGNSPAAVNLATAGNYRILSESGISDTSGSAITGQMAVSPIAATAITGFTLTMDGSGTFSTAPNVTGHIFAADYTAPTPSNLTTAVSDMQAAYTDAAGRTSPDHTNLGGGNLGGLSLTPGLYKWTTGVTIPTALTLNGGPSDVYIMQVAGTLGLSTSVHITLAGGLLPQNIFWQVSGAVTLGVSSVFEGVILGQTNIAVQTTATVHGALYAQTAVTLDDDVITS